MENGKWTTYLFITVSVPWYVSTRDHLNYREAFSVLTLPENHK